jgi:beta-xylosidase
LLLATVSALAAPTKPGPWIADDGHGSYRNPVLFADYSDPDVIRVGDDFYMVSSSFTNVPGLPILHSTDLVNWSLIGYAQQSLPSPRYDLPRHGEGIWAPSLRFHNGEYWIYYGDPDLGIFMIKARDPRGPWDAPVLVKQAKGWIDPCPLWDDDGNVYLVHAWAKSRVGFNARLTVNRLSPDGRSVIDEGVMVFDGTEHHPTIEGPKFYKRNGYYYIFAPAGGVKPGWQTVLRSKNIYGPYEDRIVLAQGSTEINGPHQGAWIDDVAGHSWFLHFQDRNAYGRITHLQPMRWSGDWPLMGEQVNGRSQPVLKWQKPRSNKPSAITTPPTSDEFDSPKLGLQWQWQANPQPEWFSTTAQPGFLRLRAVPLSSGFKNLWDVPNLLTQRFPAEEFTATAKLIMPENPDIRVGLIVLGQDYATVSVLRTASGPQLIQAVAVQASAGKSEELVAEAFPKTKTIYLRARIYAGAIVTFSYSIDGKRFERIGTEFSAKPGIWVGAQIGLFAEAMRPEATGYADFDWFHVE